jgi:hypothetical protein
MSQAESRPSLEQDLEAEMRASVSRSLAKEKALGGSGAVTALLLQKHHGDWREVERLMGLMVRRGRLEAGHG